MCVCDHLFISSYIRSDWTTAAAGFSLLRFTLLLLSPVRNVQGPAWAGAAVIAGLPRVPKYLKKEKLTKQKEKTKHKDKQNPQSRR